MPCVEGFLEMKKFYDKNGFYRASDRLKLLGNPCEGVSLGSCEEMRNRLLEEV